jgi:hypothetical protein
MILKKIILCFSLYLISFPGISQNRLPDFTLSDSATISLITAAPGRELYTRWGHSAIRIHDPKHSFDSAFNFGTFDFDTPGFYVKFLRGKLLYALSVYDFRLFEREYRYYNQSLFEQQLNLTITEKQKLYNFLVNNYKPENRYYLYDFIYDNCSTRIRDALKNVMGDTLVFRDVSSGNEHFRQVIDSYLESAPWEKFGIDLILGLPDDKQIDTWHRMFLPELLMTGFAHAVLVRDGSETQLAGPAITLFEQIPVNENIGFFTPLHVFWGLLILTLAFTFVQAVIKNNNIWPDVILFTISGLVGLAILFLWFGTDHVATKDNLNFLWLLPFNLLVPFALFKNQRNKLMNGYLIFDTALNILLLLSWKIFPQHFNIAVIPLILIFIIRSIYLLFVNYWSEKLNLKPENHVDRNGQQA